MPALSLHQLRTRHVGPIDLDIAAGECVCIRGASGSGKSLLLRAIADLDPHAGAAVLDGRACASMPGPAWRRQVALVMAEGQWWADSVGEHFPGGCTPAWLDRLGLPADALGWQVARCSTGERQRLALLRTLMQQPAVLLLDEPTGNLDEDSTARVESLLGDYRREKARIESSGLSDEDKQASIERMAKERFNEREMLRLCAEEGVGVIPWSPLARGRLTRDFDETTFRTETDQYGKGLHKGLGEADRRVIDAVAQVAAARGVPRAQVALAWVASRPGVTAPIVGASKAGHLQDAVAALSIELTPEEVATLEAPYIPHAVAGFA